jgi:hypothetical protein
MMCKRMARGATNVRIELSISRLLPSVLYLYVKLFNDSLLTAYIKLYRDELGRTTMTMMNWGGELTLNRLLCYSTTFRLLILCNIVWAMMVNDELERM